MNRQKMILTAAHLIGNGLLLYLGYFWLGMGESNAAHLLFSAAVILLFVLGALWLHGTSFVLFREEWSFYASAKRALKSLPPLFLLGLAAFGIYLLLRHFYNSFGHQAFNIGSYSTMKLRRPVEPTKVLQAFHVFIWILEWIVVPVFALPLAAEVANNGWSGFTFGAFRKSKKWLYWVEAGILVVAAIHLPLHLFFWIPKVSSFSLEVISVAARLGLGYLLFTGLLLAVEYFTSAGSPRVTQPNTVVSP